MCFIVNNNLTFSTSHRDTSCSKSEQFVKPNMAQKVRFVRKNNKGVIMKIKLDDPHSGIQK